MDIAGFKLLIVVEGNKYVGLLSIGDIQRSIISDINLNPQIESIKGLNLIVN